MTTPTFSTRNFTYGDKKFVAELSSTRLFALPKTILLQSHKTGIIVSFQYSRMIVDNEEIAAWVFRNAARNLEIHLLND